MTGYKYNLSQKEAIQIHRISVYSFKKEVIKIEINKNFSNGERVNKISPRIASFCCIIIFAISWIVNIGWLRVIFFIPMLIHALVFYFANNYHYKWTQQSKRENFLNYISYFTYTLAYTLLPDARDSPSSENVFWGIQMTPTLIFLLSEIAQLFFIASFIVIVIQIIYSTIIKYKIKKHDRPAE